MQVVIMAIASNSPLLTIRPLPHLEKSVFLICFILSPHLLLKAAGTTTLPGPPDSSPQHRGILDTCSNDCVFQLFISHSSEAPCSSHDATVMFAWCFGGNICCESLSLQAARAEDAHAKSTMFCARACTS